MKKSVNKEEFVNIMDGKDEELRLSIMGIMKEHCLSVRSVAKNIGVTELTLDRFLRSESSPHISTLSRMDKWIKKMENV